MKIKSILFLAGGIGLVTVFFINILDFQSRLHATMPLATINNDFYISQLQQDLNDLRGQLEKQSSQGLTDSHQQTNQSILDIQRQITTLIESIEKIERQEEQAEASNIHTLSTQGLSQLEQEHQHEQRQQQQTDLYVEQFQQELTDPSWSISTEQKTLDSLSQVSDKLQVDSLTCKISICQLDIARAPGISNNDALNAFETSIDWDGEMTLHYDPETGKGIVYMGRPGYNLPSLTNKS